MNKDTGVFSTLKKDLPASIVVFFVALPLCLGIALASGAPLFSGVIAGIVGGILVGTISGSKLGVSGPAAGLAAIVLTSITTLGGFENFLVAVVLSGLIQILFGVLRAGVIGYYFPSSVIKGMLSGIGIIIILKQIPHFFGYDSNYEGDVFFFQADGENTFSTLYKMMGNISPGSLIIGIISLIIMLVWDNVLAAKNKIFKTIQGPIVAVVLGIIYFNVSKSGTTFSIDPSHLVSVPVADSFSGFLGQFTFPNFAVITDVKIWVVAFTIALVASLETLLCVEATDKLDESKSITPTNRELFAQGAGNLLSGMIGGLPITQVIVRSSANIQSGARSKLSAIFHGFFLLISVILIPDLLNMIPLSVLAAILLIVGYKLAKPSLFIEMFRRGKDQYIPFVITITGIVFTDLLSGIALGLLVSIVVILLRSYRNSHFLHISKNKERSVIRMTLAEEVTFFNKGAILKELNNIPEDSCLELDVRNNKYMDQDLIEILDDFALKSKEKNIDVKLMTEKQTVKNPETYWDYFAYKI